MPDQFGRAVTYSGPFNSDWREPLGAMYAWFDGGNDPNWSIDGTVTIPAAAASTGDGGFVITNGTAQVAIGYASKVGSTRVNGSALAAADDVVVGVDPAATITNITAAGFSAGARWSGWAVDAQGAVSFGSQAGRIKMSSSDNWVFFRFKEAATNQYDGFGFAGQYLRLDASLGTGYCVFGGSMTQLASTSGSNTQFGAGETFSGTWANARLGPSDDNGLEGDWASDGAGDFRTAPVCIMASPLAGFTTVWTSWVSLGTIPAIFCSANGTLAKEWTDTPGGSTIGFNPNGGCYVARDDGTDPE